MKLKLIELIAKYIKEKDELISKRNPFSKRATHSVEVQIYKEMISDLYSLLLESDEEDITFDEII